MFEEVVNYRRGWSRADAQVMGSKLRRLVFNPVATRFLLCDLVKLITFPKPLLYPLFIMRMVEEIVGSPAIGNMEVDKKNRVPAF